jgi:hypothetical protein
MVEMLMNVELFPFLGVRFLAHIFCVALLICRQRLASGPQMHQTNGSVMISRIDKPSHPEGIDRGDIPVGRPHTPHAIDHRKFASV